MPWIDLLGNDIHYTDTGSGDAIVLVHGHGSTAACWEPFIAELSATHRVLAYDSYDHGFSSNSVRGGAMVDRADELEAFICSLRLENPVVFGQSMGSMTTLRWASRHPDVARAIVLCGMGWPLQAPTKDVASALDESERIWLGVGTSFTPEWIEANPTEYERYIRIRSTATAIEAARYPRPIHDSQPGFFSEEPAEMAKVEEGLRGITSPALFFAGDREHPAIFSAVEHAQSLIGGSRLVVVKDAAHNAYYQERGALLDAFREMVATQPMTGA